MNKEQNQCDGCNRGIPVENGIHKGDGYDMQYCTKEDYEEQNKCCPANNTQSKIEEIMLDFDQGDYVSVAPDSWNNDNIQGYNIAKKEFRAFLLSSLTDISQEARREVFEKIMEIPTREKYDGNNLESACEAYCVGAKNWTEIIRIEDGRISFKEEIRSLAKDYGVEL